MATLLLFFIFTAYVGLGVPDSLFGAAWPAIYQEFNLPISYANFITLVLQGATVISSLSSTRIVKKIGTGKTVAFSTALTALGLLGFSSAPHFIWLIISAIPLGFGGGAVDSCLNHYVALHYKAAHMNFLHSAYGVGVSLSPFLMGLLFSKGFSWQEGYQVMFFFQLAITILMFLSLLLWNSLVKQEKKTAKQEKIAAPTLLELAKVPKVPFIWLVFTASCGLEFTTGVWGASFLAAQKSFSVSKAALMITFYYVGITLGRFIAGILANFLETKKIVYLGEGLLLAAIFCLIFPFPTWVSGLGLFLIGLGNGPLFPNFIHLTPQIFPVEYAQAIIGSEMAASYVGVMALPQILGFIAQHSSLYFFPIYLGLLYCLLFASTYFLFKTKETV